MLMDKLPEWMLLQRSTIDSAPNVVAIIRETWQGNSPCVDPRKQVGVPGSPSYQCMNNKSHRSVTAGVPQRSVLGPAMRNAMSMTLEETSLVSFADNIAIVV